MQAEHAPRHIADAECRAQLIAETDRGQDLAIARTQGWLAPRGGVQTLDRSRGVGQRDELSNVVLEELIGQEGRGDGLRDLLSQ